jgi:hypothetical protein
VRRSTAWLTLISMSLTLSLTANVTSFSGHAATRPPLPSARLAHDTLSLAEVQRLSKNADQHVIVILRDPSHSLPHQGTTPAARAAAIACRRACMTWISASPSRTPMTTCKGPWSTPMACRSTCRAR